MIDETVIQILLTDPPVAAIVGARVYPNELPDASTFPALVVTKVSGGGSYTLQGDAGLEDARVQVDCYEDGGKEKLNILRRAVRRCLSGYRGGPLSGSPCAIDSVFVLNEIDLAVPETVRTGPRLRRRMIDFRIWNREI